jgi:hypothetical protein
MCGLPNLMDELERLIQSGSRQKERLSGWVLRVLSDLGVVEQVQHEINIYQPWATTMDDHYAKSEKEINEEFTRRFEILSDLCKNFEALPLAKVGTPVEKFNYPLNKRRTHQNVERMRKGEGNLDLFGRQLISAIKTMLGDHCTRRCSTSLIGSSIGTDT